MATKKSIDAIALLKADHRKVEALFAKAEKAKGAAKQKIALEICLELCVHTAIEEEIFYPACTGEVDGKLLNEAYVEHDGAKVLIAEIIGGEASDEFFGAKVKVLSEMIKHHVKEEEKRSEGLFAQAKEAGVDVEQLGMRMMERKLELTKKYKEEGLPTPATRSFTGHELTQSEPIKQAA